MEFEIRAWHTELKQMISWENIKMYYSMYFIFDYGTLERMPYTGQKDKNGNKVYLYDIIKLAENYFSIVLWNNEKSSFYAKSIGGSEVESEHLFGIQLAEVIGNKFENTELLNSRIV